MYISSYINSKRLPSLLLFVMLCCPAMLHAAGDSTMKKFSYVRLGVDLFKPAQGLFDRTHSSYEIQADAYYSKSIWLAAEAGYGKSDITNDNLSYKSSNSFLRLGVDHPFFNPEFLGDKDNAFVGLRYAVANVHRGASSYVINDPIWGATYHDYPAGNLWAHWIELTGGFRLEIKKHLFMGWNLRMKSILNQKKFQTFPPAYLAGYGRGDKNTQVDFNLYVLYGFGKR